MVKTCEDCKAELPRNVVSVSLGTGEFNCEPCFMTKVYLFFYLLFLIIIISLLFFNITFSSYYFL